jgi:hypothetical protein
MVTTADERMTDIDARFVVLAVGTAGKVDGRARIL